MRSKIEFQGTALEIGIQNSGKVKGFHYIIFDFLASIIYFVDAVRLGFLIFFLVLRIWLELIG